MAINKAQTSMFMKVMLGIIAFTFIVSLIPWQSGGLGGSSQNNAATKSNELATIAAQYGNTIGTYESLLVSDPTSATVLVNLGNVYFDWADQVSRASTAAVGQARGVAERPMWRSAISYYERAVQTTGGATPAVQTDMAIAYLNVGESARALEICNSVIKQDPKFPMAWLWKGNALLGATGQEAEAIAAFEKYIALDAKGQNVDYAKAKISELKVTAGK